MYCEHSRLRILAQGLIEINLSSPIMQLTVLIARLGWRKSIWLDHELFHMIKQPVAMVVATGGGGAAAAIAI